jgi:hypothetical protein
MQPRKFDKRFTDFPLCFLSIGKHSFIKQINAWVLFKYIISQDSYFEFEFADSEYNNTSLRELVNNKILTAAEELKIAPGALNEFKTNYKILDSLYSDFRSNYGEDAFCRIGHQLITEVRKDLFDWDLFRTYCAIHSIIGKKRYYARVCKKQILIRMNGFKSEKLHHIYKQEISFISRYKLDKLIELLELKKMINKVTVLNRLTYYSTRYSKKKLMEVVQHKLIMNKKRKLKLEEHLWNRKLADELTAIDKSRIENSNMRYNHLN